MCGIAGIIGPHIGTADTQLVEKMTAVLAHRGPDGDGFAHGERFAFGHRRLSIIDIEQGAQPMLSADDRYVLTYNGEIYNYKELRVELEAEGVSFRTNSDTEVLLQALINYGHKAMDKLIGMYAFAFHDKKTGRTLLARDEMGVKPLYYTVCDGKVHFASEIKALLQNPAVQVKLNAHAQKQYMTFQFCLEELTLYDGIYALKAAHYIEIKAAADLEKSLKQKAYWHLDYNTDFSMTEDSCHEELDALIHDSLRLQLRSDVPLGAYLSGGIDSSFITAMASENLGKGVDTFHGRFAEGLDFDESRYAKDVCKMHKANYIETVPTAEDFVHYLPKIIYHMDEPTAGPGVFPQYCVSHKASDHVKVVLGGQGGDEIFGGYARYVVAYLEQALKGAITNSNEEGKHIVSLASIAPNLGILEQYTPMLKSFWSSGLFEGMDKRYFKLVDRSPNINKIMAYELFDDHARDEIFADFQSVFNAPDTVSYINKMTNFDLHTLLPALLQIEDRVSMSASIETRVPFIDKRIVQLMAKTSPTIKFAGGKTKNALRKVAQPVLPASVMDRRDKMGFPVPLNEWMRKGVVKEFVSDILLSQRSRERGMFDMIEMEKLIHAEAKFGRELWGALCIELWYQIFVDKSFKV